MLYSLLFLHLCLLPTACWHEASATPQQSSTDGICMVRARNSASLALYCDNIIRCDGQLWIVKLLSGSPQAATFKPTKIAPTVAQYIQSVTEVNGAVIACLDHRTKTADSQSRTGNANSDGGRQ
ncbi:TPA: hypothetical protein ACH3X1_001354 [Trebouxia sp. C0004]